MKYSEEKIHLFTALHSPKGVVRHPTLREKRVPKRCPWGTIATNGTIFLKGHSFSLNNRVYEKRVQHGFFEPLGT